MQNSLILNQFQWLLFKGIEYNQPCIKETFLIRFFFRC
jgi:hypothetical protein